MDTKETTQGVVKEIEALKIEKASTLAKKENINADTTLLLDAISRTRSRIVQSPERIKHNIATMAAAAIEDKKIIGQQEAKARDLQAKISALSIIDKVSSIELTFTFDSMFLTQDLRACVEQLQTTDKEVQLLEASQKELADVKDSLDYKNIERSELQMKKEVREPFFLSYARPMKHRHCRECTGSSLTPMISWNAHKGTPRKSGMQVSRPLNGCSVNTSRWTSREEIMTGRLRNFARKPMRLKQRFAS